MCNSYSSALRIASLCGPSGFLAHSSTATRLNASGDQSITSCFNKRRGTWMQAPPCPVYTATRREGRGGTEDQLGRSREPSHEAATIQRGRLGRTSANRRLYSQGVPFRSPSRWEVMNEIMSRRAVKRVTIRKTYTLSNTTATAYSYSPGTVRRLLILRGSEGTEVLS